MQTKRLHAQEESGLSDELLRSFAREKLATLEAQSLLRTLSTTERFPGGRAKRNARELISFSCNDYLGLSQHPDVVEANQRATRQFGVGAGGSRLVLGNNPLYARLEADLARIKGTEDAIVFGSGYLANVGVIPVLAGPEDLILMDELCHACLYAGTTLARSRVIRFTHKDTGGVAHLLAEHRKSHRHCLVLTDGVFSMDGDRAPVAELLELTQRHDAWLMTDDAHGLGVIENGRGSGVIDGRAIPVPLQMGTLSKAVGAYGGYLCASRDVVELMRNRARSLLYTTGLPPGTLAAAIAALEIIESDVELVAKPLGHARRFAEAIGLPEPQSPIVPILLGDVGPTLRASEELEEHGFLVVPIRPPTVPEGTARLRCTFSASHTEQDVARFAAAVTEVLETL